MTIQGDKLHKHIGSCVMVLAKSHLSGWNKLGLNESLVMHITLSLIEFFTRIH